MSDKSSAESSQDKPSSDLFTVKYRKDYQPYPHRLLEAKLTFDLSIEHVLVTNDMLFELGSQYGVKSDHAIVLDGEWAFCEGVCIDGKTAKVNTDYFVSNGQMSITNEALEHVRLKGGRCHITIITSFNPSYNTALSGMYVSDGRIFTQCEAEGFRRMTFFPDRPDVLTRYTTVLRADADKFPFLLSNGTKIKAEILEDNIQQVIWHDPFLKPCYLFAVVAGDFAVHRDTYRTRSGRNVNLEIYVEPVDINRTSHAMSSLKKAMEFDELFYQREYDLDVYMICAVSNFNMGAMENKGLNIFNTKYVLAESKLATDLDYARIERIIAHEYFHNWTGNRITLRDWFQLSLKEGLTVYREHQFAKWSQKNPLERLGEAKTMIYDQFSEDAGPLSHPVRPDTYIEMNNFYTLTVYEKGAEIVGMLSTILGEEGYYRGMKNYFTLYDGQAVTIESFIHAMEEANNYCLKQFMHWYSQSGTPHVSVIRKWDKKDQTLTLDFEQNITKNENNQNNPPLQIPLSMTLISSNGQNIKGKLINEKNKNMAWSYSDREILGQINTVKTSIQWVPSEPQEQSPIIMLNRNFSAPINVEHDLSFEELGKIMLYDDDIFNRWQAQQQMVQELFAIYQNNKFINGDNSSQLNYWLSIYQDLVSQQEISPHLLGTLLSLPTERILARASNNIEVENLISFAKYISKKLTYSLQDWLKSKIKALNPQDNLHDSQLQGERFLKGVLSKLLLDVNIDEYAPQIYQNYKQALTMTEKQSALEALACFESPYSHKAIDDFYNEYQKEPLAIEKWISVHALLKNNNILERMRKIQSHKAFDIAKPNHVYSLFITFMKNNYQGFHRADGDGYRFIGEVIMQLDDINPQVAARVATGFSDYQRLPKEYQSKMALVLEKILSKSGVSKDVYEICEKIFSI